MIGLCLIFGSMFSEFPSWKGEFEEYEEFFGEKPAASIPQLIAEQENRDALVELVEEETNVPFVEDLEIEEVLASLVSDGETIVDTGMGLSPFLSKCTSGNVYAFEKDPCSFSERYWQLVKAHCFNVSLYCFILGQKEKKLDDFQFENIGLICVSAKGRENLFLKGAERTIEKNRPALFINLIGGLSFEEGDRYIKEELERRIEGIEEMGYSVKRIRGDLHLALPL